jgi:hypothetical protein
LRTVILLRSIPIEVVVNQRKAGKWHLKLLYNPTLLFFSTFYWVSTLILILDLGIVAAEICPGQELQNFAGDFEKINNTIADLLDPIQEVVSQFSPLLGISKIIR